MSANRSSAVMQQRHEALDSLDDFPTPPWAARALLEALEPWQSWPDRSVWEPAANRGALLRGLQGGVGTIHTSDVHNYGAGHAVEDFLMPGPPPFAADWVITNPPFRLAEQFAKRGLEVASCGVALLVRAAFLEGGTRHRDLFASHPPSLILQHCERVIMHRGVLRDPSVKYWDPAANGGAGGWKLPSTATAYAWLVWEKGSDEFRRGRTSFRWIAPCRKRLERAGDYAPFACEAAA